MFGTREKHLLKEACSQLSNSHNLDGIVKNSRIIIVEDDKDVSNLIHKHFDRNGFDNIAAASNGTDALRDILLSIEENNPFDLIILDLMLPGGPSGQDIYRQLSSTVDIPIIIITALPDKDTQLDALQYMDVEDYFVKPLDMDIFILKCERALSRRIFSRKMTESSKRSQKLFLNVLQVMAKVLETKDPYTRFHSENVAKYARKLARKCGYDDERLEMIQIAGILHDFGKIGIAEVVLNKKGSLTEPEYMAVQKHPLIASAILEPIEELKEVIQDIRHHHERFDGRGYPDKLCGEEIPLGARILCIADSFDAMTSNRAYHDSMTLSEAREEMMRCSGTQFDPELIKHLLDIQDEELEKQERFDHLKNLLDDEND
ncbi:MAG: HD domain-containing phosphohydrolase [Planctomycetota bacterium]|jgi:putative two-component system response regulator